MRAIKGLVSGISNYYNNFIESINNSISSLRDQFKLFSKALSDPADANNNLAEYFMREGRIKDAIFRLKLNRAIFAKKDPRIDLNLGWCYFLLGDQEKSLNYLRNASDLDKLNLQDFVLNIQNYKDVPHEIWQRIRNFNIKSKSIIANNEKLYKNLLNLIFQELGDVNHDLKILDFGADSGKFAAFFTHRSNVVLSITAVEDNELAVNQLREMQSRNNQIFSKILNYDLRTFLNKTVKEFDLVVCIDSLAFTLDLKHYLSLIKKSLTSSAIAALVIETGEKTAWDMQYKKYVYDQQYIENQIKLAEFSNFSINNYIHEDSNRNFSIIVLNK